ncbi:MAG: hypothetical protein AB7V43_10145 [Acidimicrobiia bacterium]
MKSSLFTRLDMEWSDIIRRSESTEQLRLWAVDDSALRRFDDLDEMVRFARTPGHPAESDEVLASLARLSVSDALAARALLQAVLYALVPLSVRFRTSIKEADETAAMVVAAAYERIRTYPMDRRPQHIAANIILDTQQGVSRTVCRPRVTEVAMGDIADLAIEATGPSAGDQVIELIAEALRNGSMCHTDARIILLTRFLDVAADDLAVDYGMMPHSLRRRRLRAEAQLSDLVA